MDLLQLPLIHIFIVIFPFAIFDSEIVKFAPNALQTTHLVLFQSVDHFLKTTHFALNNSIHAVNVFQSSFFQIEQTVFSVGNLTLNSTLSTVNIGLYFV